MPTSLSPIIRLHGTVPEVTFTCVEHGERGLEFHFSAPNKNGQKLTLYAVLNQRLYKKQKLGQHVAVLNLPAEIVTDDATLVFHLSAFDTTPLFSYETLIDNENYEPDASDIAFIHSQRCFVKRHYEIQAKAQFKSDEEAIRHYLKHGRFAMLSPNPLFDAHFIEKKQNWPFPPDLFSYLIGGYKKHKTTSSHFSGRLYAQSFKVNEDQSELSHFYEAFVLSEADCPLPTLQFDAQYYADTNPDVSKQEVDLFWHFMHFGWKENRNPNPHFSSLFYKLLNPDVKETEMNPFLHYLYFGHKEGRKISRKFRLENVKPFIKTDTTLPTAKISEIDVVLPFFNGYHFLAKLLPQLIEHTKGNYTLHLINDCSTDEQTTAFVEQFALAHQHVKLLTNKENIGFVKSVNLVLKNTKKHVVILNSDVEVPHNWLHRLCYPALEDPSIGSVTPFTNAGTLASYPIINQDNTLYLASDIVEADAAFTLLAQNGTVEIPTGVGFCMFINQRCLAEIGGFDEEHFNRGYGEENDWCRRAVKAGYKNVLLPSLFVWHKHGGSFSEKEKQLLIKENNKNLLKKHPEYFEVVSKHFEDDPARELRFFLICKQIEKQSNQGISLLIDHDLGGGANIFSKNQANAIRENEGVFLLRYNTQLTLFVVSMQFKNQSHEAYFNSLEESFEFLNLFELSCINLNNAVSYPDIFQLLERCKYLRSKKESTLRLYLHDYLPICPSFTLLNASNKFCQAETNAEICNKCLPNNKNTAANGIKIEVWREAWRQCIEIADEVVAFSRSSAGYMQYVFGEEILHSKLKIAPHSTQPPFSFKSKLSLNADLHIGIIGTINLHKGAEKIRKLVQYLDKTKQGKITLIGELHANPINSPRFQLTGKYTVEQLPGLVHELGISTLFFPSIWPETFSFVTTEIIALNLPVVAFNLGAPAERLKQYSKAQLLDENASEKEIYLSLRALHLREKADQHADLLNRIKASEYFDEEYYLSENSDVKAEGYDAALHYLLHGASEGRNPSKKFDTNYYLNHNLDVKKANLNPLLHFLDHGLQEGRMPLPPQQTDVLLKTIQLAKNWKVGLLIHAFYEDLIPELVATAKQFPEPPKMLISVCSEKAFKKAEETIKQASLVNTVIKKVENRGRDIAPAFTAFRSEIAQLDLICKIHGKKSLYTGSEQITWRRQLIQGIAGSNVIVQNALHQFEQNPKLGVLYANSNLLPYWAFNWLSNKEKGFFLSQKLEIPIDFSDFIDYPMGSMFWFRPKALQQLFSDKLSLLDFEEEPCGNDETLAHAIERAIVSIARHNGYFNLEWNLENQQLFRGTGSKNLHQYAQKNLAELKAQINEHDIISFDVFDTLINRKALFPQHINKAIAHYFDQKFEADSDFTSLRLAAEQKAREVLQTDVNLAEIYSFFEIQSPWTPERVEEAKQLELKFEIDCCGVRYDMLEAYQYAKEQNKTVILVSDMYLKESFIKLLLEKAGVNGFDKIYVSNRYKKRKETAELWELVFKDFPTKNLLHIGDNPHADIQLVIDRGRTPYHIMNSKQLFENTRFGIDYITRFPAWQEHVFLGPIVQRLMNSPFCAHYTNQHLQLKKSSASELTGYAAFGPMMLVFCESLLKRAKETGSTTLYFLSREGYFLKTFFEHYVKLRGEEKSFETRYLLASRQALLSCLEKTEKSIASIIDSNHFTGNLDTLLEQRFGVTCADLCEEDRMVNLPEDAEWCKNMLLKHREKLNTVATLCRSKYLKYLDTEDFTSAKNPLVVDIGYSGTIQNALITITGKKVLGYYFVTSSACNLNRGAQQLAKACFKELAPKTDDTPAFKFNLYLESWLTSPQGQFVGLEQLKNTLNPVFKNREQDDKLFEINKLLAKGVCSYFDDILTNDFFRSSELNLSAETAQGVFEAFVVHDLWDEGFRKIAFLEDEFCGNQSLDVIGDYKKYVL